MPNRIIKESICTSCEVDQLTTQQENFFYRLLVQCDDYGRMDARPSILRAKCFPLKLERISAKDISGYLKALFEVGLIQVYMVEGKPYLCFATWEKHQQIRAKKPKYPSIDDGELLTSEIIGNHLISDAPVIQSNPIQSKKKYGELKNVLLKDEELEKLKTKFTDYQERIERLGEYKASHGKKYDSDYATILNWSRKDKTEEDAHGTREYGS